MLGTDGYYAADPEKLLFLMNTGTKLKAIRFPEVLTVDKYGTDASIRTGQVNQLFGVEMLATPRIGLANSAGKIDLDTASNNTLGRILLVRPDQWIFASWREITLETEYSAYAQATTVISTLRFGLASFDNEPAAISYNLTM
jgi:hypothetical protein